MLVHPENMRSARELLAKGLRTSEKMRQSALRESDDEHEWLANPRQTHSVFPVPLDDVDFKIWGELMTHLIPLVEGKTLLPPIDQLEGKLGRVARACSPGHGLDVAQIFRDPPRSLFALIDRPDAKRGAAAYCRKIDGTHPVSGIGGFLATYAGQLQDDQHAFLRFMRNLLWVN